MVCVEDYYEKTMKPNQGLTVDIGACSLHTKYWYLRQIIPSPTVDRMVR